MLQKNIDILKNLQDMYNGDSAIFDKGIKLYEVYSVGADWPYSLEKLDEVSTSILGARYSEICRVGILLKDDSLEWNKLSENFYKEFVYFYNTVGIMFNRAWYKRFSMNDLWGMSYVKGLDKKYNVRLIRNDDMCLDISISRHDVRELIHSLEVMIENHDANQEDQYIGGK